MSGCPDFPISLLPLDADGHLIGLIALAGLHQLTDFFHRYGMGGSKLARHQRNLGAVLHAFHVEIGFEQLVAAGHYAMVLHQNGVMFGNQRPQSVGEFLRAGHAITGQGNLAKGSNHLGYQRLFQADRPERMMLLSRALSSLELPAAGSIATMKLRLGDFAETGARQDETENLVNEPMRMGCVEVSMLLVQTPDDGGRCIRVSLRSRGGVDVAAVARRFGGGGHVQAAGLRADEDIDTLAANLVAACRAAMETQCSVS